MKIRHLIFSGLAFAALATACQPNEQLGAAELTVNPTELSFGPEAGSKSVTIKATRDWVVENLPEWVALDPKSGIASSKDQTVTVTVMPNSGVDRSADVKFSIGLMSKVLKVSQSGEAGNEEDALLYFNDFDKQESTKTFGSSKSSWPYLDQFEGWRNERGNGVSTAEHAFNKVSVRSNSPSNTHNSDNYTGSGLNNLLFAQNGYLAIKKIALNGATGLVMTFGTEKYLVEGDNTFNHSEFLVGASIDGEHFANVEYAFPAGDLAGTWDLAKAEFAVPAGTEYLYLHFTSSIVSGHRLDDLKLLRGGNGAVLDYANGKYIDLSDGTTPGDAGDEPTEFKAVTVAEFLAAPESKTQVYELVGTIGGSINAEYGNFDLTDDSGKVYVYGMTAKYLGYGADNDKSYGSLGLNSGDKIKVRGYRGSFTDKSGTKKDELLYSWFISKEGSGEVVPPTPIDGENLDAIIAKKNPETSVDVQTNEVLVGAVTTKGFVVTDGTNHIYVFTSSAPAAKIGDKVTVRGKLIDYYGLPEITDPTVNVVSSGNTVPYPAPKDITSTIDSYSSGVAEYITVSAEAYASDAYINYKIEGATRGVELSSAPSSLVSSIKAGDKVTLTGYFNTIHSKRNNVQLILVKVEGGSGETPGGDTPGGDTPDPDATDYSSDIPWTAITGSSNSEGVGTINGSTKQYPIFKFGTSSKLGEGTMTLPAGANGFSFIAVGWTSTGATLNFEVGGKTTTFEVPANASVSGNTPWNITFSATDSVSGEVKLDAPAAAETTVRIFTSGDAKKGRCLLFATKKL